MNWKQYKNLPENEKRNENYYIIGLDLGNDSSCIAFYNKGAKEAEIIDLSGGYGHPTIPTAMQYVVDSKEWVFGEYVILNSDIGEEFTVKDLIERLGSSEYLEISGRPISLVNLLGMFIRELISKVKNINPNAEIVGIVAAVPSYLSAQAREELVRAFKNAGYEKELIDLVSDNECIFSYADEIPKTSLLIDYGARGVRGGVFESNDTSIRTVTALFDDMLGTKSMEKEVQKLFSSFYKTNTKTEPAQEQIAAFTYQHKDILFQKAIQAKAAKLYFNFAFPPFQQTVNAKHANTIIEPFREGFNQFIQQLTGVKPIDKVICVGGGFEMLWVKEAIAKFFSPDKICEYKNSKIIAALGAAFTAAKRLDVAEGQVLSIEDRHHVPMDVGLLVGDNSFMPLVEYNSFWWKPHPPHFFIINNPVERGEELPFTLLSRTQTGEIKTLVNTRLRGLPKRPKGTTKLQVQIKFSSDREAIATVRDYGFGELFPRTDFEQEILVRLGESHELGIV